MVLLKTVNFRSVALHGGTYAHLSYTNSKSINLVENRLQLYISKIYYKYLDYSRRRNYTTRLNEPIKTILFLIYRTFDTIRTLKEKHCS